jgi:hypothetical protein
MILGAVVLSEDRMQRISLIPCASVGDGLFFFVQRHRGCKLGGLATTTGMDGRK